MKAACPHCGATVQISKARKVFKHKYPASEGECPGSGRTLPDPTGIATAAGIAVQDPPEDEPPEDERAPLSKADLPVHPDMPQQCHLYRNRHLFFGDHYLGKLDRAEQTVEIFPEFSFLEPEIADFVGRLTGQQMPISYVGAPLNRPQPLLEFPPHIRAIMEAPIDPANALSPTAGDEHPEALAYAIENWPAEEVDRRYRGRWTVAALLHRFEQEQREVVPFEGDQVPEDAEREKPHQEVSTVAPGAQETTEPPEELGADEGPPPTPTGSTIVLQDWDIEVDGNASEFVCHDCLADNDGDEDAARHPIEDFAGRDAEEDHPICRDCSQKYTTGGG